MIRDRSKLNNVAICIWYKNGANQPCIDKIDYEFIDFYVEGATDHNGRIYRRTFLVFWKEISHVKEANIHISKIREIIESGYQELMIYPESVEMWLQMEIFDLKGDIFIETELFKPIKNCNLGYGLSLM